MVTEPAAMPFTSPVPETVATAIALLDHVTTRPVRTLPAESLVTTDSCSVDPMFTPLDAGDTVTDATGTTVTVIVAAPLCPSLVAVIVAEPTATAVTRPFADTVATLDALLDHVIVRPVSTLPAASLVVAVGCPDVLTRSVFVAGARVTGATGTTATVMVAVPVLPSLVAVIVTDPAATAATSPLAETVATAGVPLDQVTIRPVSTFPTESSVVALSCTVVPTFRLLLAGDMLTDATGTAQTVMAAIPLWPSLAAVIVADPAARPLTSPAADTVADAGALLDHVTT